ncbi:hypothetical protein IG631_09314 [Alternaria alternata]|nr:hypothetical protein IG631_09314 [Alternaria alternata]
MQPPRTCHDLVHLTRLSPAAITQSTRCLNRQHFTARRLAWSATSRPSSQSTPRMWKARPDPHRGGTGTASSAEELKEAVMLKTYTIDQPRSALPPVHADFDFLMAFCCKSPWLARFQNASTR